MTPGLLTVLDDITVLLDDVAAMSKVATKKTAALVGDDLAVNANVVVGLDPKRELPIVGKIALGSLVNKALLIPLALLLPHRLIGPLLLFGGAFLCYEALHKLLHRKKSSAEKPVSKKPELDPAAVEKKKVWGAIGTDTILSAEVLAVALGAVASAPLLTKALTLAFVGVAMTVVVYGTVALIVKADDVGLKLERSATVWLQKLGAFIVRATPRFMGVLSFVGTMAMLLVGGGILVHGVPSLEHGVEAFTQGVTQSGLLRSALGFGVNLLAGLVLGLLSYPVFTLLGSGIERLTTSLRGGKGQVVRSTPSDSPTNPGRPLRAPAG